MTKLFQASVFLLILILVTSCEAIGYIFSAGFYAGIFFVVLVVGLIIFLIAKMSNRK